MNPGVYYFLGSMLLAKSENNVLTYLHSDHLGSVVLETNTAGNIVNDQRCYAYGRRCYAYGRRLDTGGDTSGEKDLTGQRKDATGLVYMNARYYDPTLEQFISPDTIVPDPNSWISYNRYLYANGNPVKYNDPSGHCIFAVADTVAYILIGGAAVLKAIDYGWTAWDIYQDSRTLADPNAERSDKLLAGLNIGLAVFLETAEPDDVLPVGLPLDDVGRRTLLAGAREAFDRGGEDGLQIYVRHYLGENADAVPTTWACLNIMLT